jgi:hypothetical protein
MNHHSTIGNLSMSIGALSWFHNVSIYNEKVIECWTIFSLKINLSQN